MESPVVVDKPPEYHGNSDRGFPFEEEEGSGAWSELAARHPDIAARLRQRPATWARKRRPSSQDAADDFGDSFTGFDRFPFDDIPAEFREHFPSHWNRRYSDREQPEPAPQPAPAPPSPQHHTAATQTEHEPEPAAPEPSLPQYGLRNTVDLGQRSAADPCVDAEERAQRSMSAPPDAPRTAPDMNSHPHEAHAPPQEHHSNVRHIPIFVEGRDEPVINRSVDQGTQFAESKPQHQPPPPQQPHIDRDAYFADDGPVGFHHPPNFTRAFGTPFNKGFRQGPQPFVQQKAYPQTAFARGASPQRAQSPLRDEHFAKVPVQHEQAPPRPSPPRAAQQQQQQQAPPQQKAPPRAQPPPPAREPTPPARAPPASNDPITQILSIQTDVLNLMTEVENFAGTKKDKRYLFLDEMLTRNLIKLDNIETDGKENIRQARKEAIKCIQKCIAVLEAKAESNGAAQAQASAQGQDVEMKEGAADVQGAPAAAQHATNGEVEMKEPPQAEEKVEAERINEPSKDVKEEAKPEEQTQKVETEPAETQPAADTRPDQHATDEQNKEVDNKASPKKKVVKKRDKSKEAAKEGTEVAAESSTEASKDSSKTEVAQDRAEVMQVDDKEKPMEVDGAASQ